MRITKLGALATAGLLALGALAGCSGQADQDAGLNGDLAISGATALQPLAQVAADKFMEQNPELNITVKGGGSGTGLSEVSDGTVDIGDSDVFAEEKLDADKAKELVDHQVAVIAFAPVVNPGLGIDDLTKQQLKDIFTGKVTNWKEVGGPDVPIALVTRPSSSGTRATFQKYALEGAEEVTGSNLETDDSGTLMETVKKQKGGIGYLALSYLIDPNAGVKAVSIDGVEPTYENVYDGSYTVWGYEHMYTKGEDNANAKAFITYMTSDEFGKIAEQNGYGVAAKLTTAAKDSHK